MFGQDEEEKKAQVPIRRKVVQVPVLVVVVVAKKQLFKIGVSVCFCPCTRRSSVTKLAALRSFELSQQQQ